VKILIITVAGSSTRFSKSIGREVLKCIYYEKSFSDSLLYGMLHQPVEFDKYVIVGGYKYDELKAAIHNELSDYGDRIDLIYNEHFADYGSGYSLYCGLLKALEYPFDEIIFAEGDLFVDPETFRIVAESKKSIVTSNQEPILANKAVAFYYDEHHLIRYVYDTGHAALMIDEPFLAIYNSGQIWKFADKQLVRKIVEDLDEAQWQGTNLVMVERYFRSLAPSDFDNVKFDKWINCNTIEDFKNINGRC